MSEIKVGDICKVNGYARNVDTGVFHYFNNHRVGIYASGMPLQGIFFNFNSEVYEAHRKQCRKLVKIRKCDYCKGSGLIHPVGICDWCNGRGKVKV